MSVQTVGEMKAYICTNHEGYWIGGASVVVAEDEKQARELLDAELVGHGLNPSWKYPYTLQKLNLSVPHAVVLQDGDY